MGTKKGQVRKTARRAYEPKKKKKELSRARGFGQVNPFASNALDNLKKLKGAKK
jgi:hypothetical protein